MSGTRKRAPRVVCVGIMIIAVLAALPAVFAGAASLAPGAAKPNPSTGMNTAAAFDNPLCRKDAGPYGRLDWVVEGGGPVCIAEWKGTKNGGSTHQGVTKDSIKIVLLVPNSQQLATARRDQLPTNLATGDVGTIEDAVRDTFAVYEHQAYQTYGRSIDLEFVTSTGDDEAAQHSDALTVKAAKPFLVIDGTYTSQPVFGTDLAAAKIPVFANSASLESTIQQAPYRWAQTDVNAGAINAAEFVGKQLVGRKAEYAGDESMHTRTRVLGLVYADPITYMRAFNKAAKTYGAKFAPEATFAYPASEDPFGDPVVSQEMAPTMIAKLKSLGVTSVLLLADSGMVSALLKEATTNEYHPEWIIGSFNYSDFAFFARQYDQTQWAHAFGISNLPPVYPTATTTSNPGNAAIAWYWGEGTGTSSLLHNNIIDKVIRGITYAGPRLTPQTFKRGLFSQPAYGGSASDQNYSIQQGFGRTSGLPYDEYLAGNKDFILAWWDPDTVGPPVLGIPGGNGTLWYLNDAQRFYSSTWPTKPVKFFDKSNSIYQLDSPPPVSAAVPCDSCPSETGQGQPAASSS